MTSTVRDAYALVNKNGNEYWRNNIIKETNNISFVLDILEESDHPLPMHSYMPCHMVLYVNIKFTRKSRYVTRGCNAPKSDYGCYAGIVLRESGRIFFN